MKKTIGAAALMATVAFSTAAFAGETARKPASAEDGTLVGCKEKGKDCAWAPQTDVEELDNGDRATIAYCPEGSKVVTKNVKFCAQPKPVML